MDPSLQAIVDSAEYLVAFTGAGVSTLSGLPDFRGQGGLYSDPNAWKIFDLETFRVDPSIYYQGVTSFLYGNHDLSSSLVHHTLSQWQAEGKLKALITQNIDLLHQKAGSPEVIEVHGSPAVHHCLRCQAVFSYQEIVQRLKVNPVPPVCTCGGSIKPDITFFGEALPETAFENALEAVARADVLLILGTSLTVYPAAGLPDICLKNHGKIVIINAQPTHLDSQAVLVLRDLEKAFS